MWGRLKFVYEAPNWIALNQTMQSQTMVSIAKVSCEIWALLGYYAAQSGDSWPTLLDNLLAPSSKVKKSKRENSTTKVHWHSIFWGVSVHRLIFERSTMFQKPALFLFSNKEAPNLVYSLDWTVLNHCTPYKQYLIKIRIWEQIQSKGSNTKIVFFF